jgi:hypothetical protein
VCVAPRPTVHRSLVRAWVLGNRSLRLERARYDTRRPLARETAVQRPTLAPLVVSASIEVTVASMQRSRPDVRTVARIRRALRCLQVPSERRLYAEHNAPTGCSDVTPCGEAAVKSDESRAVLR